jgi:lactate dehydrogenase-like 2-hydroxyacid dehydrogenase
MGFPYTDSATTQAVFFDDTDYFFGEELDTDRTKEFRYCDSKHVGVNINILPTGTSFDALQVQQQELLLTTEINSNHVDLPTVVAMGCIIVEVIDSNTVSVVEAQLMCALILKRNLLSGHH